VPAACWLHGRLIDPLEEIACGSVITANAPAATTKIAVPIAAAGRSHAYLDLAWPEPAGLNRSTVAQNRSAVDSAAGRAQAMNRPLRSAYQPATMAKDSSEGGAIRSRIRSRPSADGSTDSAAACSARRSTSP
jgi:hypothetical protein